MVQQALVLVLHILLLLVPLVPQVHLAMVDLEQGHLSLLLFHLALMLAVAGVLIIPIQQQGMVLLVGRVAVLHIPVQWALLAPGVPVHLGKDLRVVAVFSQVHLVLAAAAVGQARLAQTLLLLKQVLEVPGQHLQLLDHQ